MTEIPKVPISGPELVTIHLQRITWAFQRQLAAATLSLTSALGAFGVLNSLNIFWVYIPLFLFLMMCVLIGLYGILVFEREILNHQAKLQIIQPKWGLDKNKSTFSWFFDREGISYKLKHTRLAAFLLIPITISSFIFYDMKIVQKSLFSSVIFIDPNYSGFIGLIAGLISGFILFLLEDSVRRSRDNNVNKQKMINGLILELKETKRILLESTYAPLTRDIWDNWKRNDPLLEYNETLYSHLMTISAIISNRNNLLTFYQIGVQSGKSMGITNSDGTITEPLTKILADQRQKIEIEIDIVLPLLEKLL